MNKFQNKYRIPSARLASWDYSSTGMYFLTICAKDRDCYFGKIEKDKMILNELGKIAHSEWMKTPQIRPDMNLQLGEFVVMPNHFHGIVIIGENKFNSGGGFSDGGGRDIGCRDAMHGVSTVQTPDTPDTPGIKTNAYATVVSKNKFAPQSKNIGSVIRGFKSSVTTYARKNNIEFNWQTCFHDHIIRSQDEYIRISNYITNNPANWGTDNFNNDNFKSQLGG